MQATGVKCDSRRVMLMTHVSFLENKVLHAVNFVLDLKKGEGMCKDL